MIIVIIVVIVIIVISIIPATNSVFRQVISQFPEVGQVH
jgi:hypothetical protein